MGTGNPEQLSLCCRRSLLGREVAPSRDKQGRGVVSETQVQVSKSQCCYFPATESLQRSENAQSVAASTVKRVQMKSSL